MRQQPAYSQTKQESPSSREVVLSRLITKLETDMKSDTGLRNKLTLGITKYGLSHKLKDESLVNKLFAAYLLEIGMKEQFVFQVVTDMDELSSESISTILQLPKEEIAETDAIVIPLDNSSPEFYKESEAQFEIADYDQERIEYLKLTLLKLNLTYEDVISGLTPEGLNRKYSYQLYTLSNGLIVAICPQQKEATYVIKPNEQTTTQDIVNLTKQEIKDYCNTNQFPLEIIKHDKKEKWKTTLTSILQHPESIACTSTLTVVEKLWQVVKIINESGVKPSKYDQNPLIRSIGHALFNFKKGKYKNLPPELRETLDKQLEMLNEQHLQRFHSIIEYIKEHGKRPSETDNNPEIKYLGKVLFHYREGKYKNLPPELRETLDNQLEMLNEQHLQRFQSIIEYIQEHNKIPSTLNKDPKIKYLGVVLSRYKRGSYKTLPIEIRQELDALLVNLKQK
jgi:hypothetical protein